ncbi:MAG: hypothetical protein ACKO3G_07980 [Planctomycetaceae bacterium]
MSRTVAESPSDANASTRPSDVLAVFCVAEEVGYPGGDFLA